MLNGIKRKYNDYITNLRIIKGDVTHGVSNEQKLYNGVAIPGIGFGTFQLQGEECTQSVYEAIKCGYRLIDTASAYENELYVGKGIKKALDEAICQRSDLFISTKIWIQDYGDLDTKEAFSRALERLNIDYLDLCILHYPFGDIYGAWRALEQLHLDGKIRAIGVSNFTSDRLQDFLQHVSVKPMVNQIETNPFIQQIGEQAFLNRHAIVQEAWSPLATGKRGIWSNYLLKIIAIKHKATVGTIVVRWLMQRKIIPIVKSANHDHMMQNIDVAGVSLSDIEMIVISMINRNRSVYFGKRGLHNVKLVETIGSTEYDT